ncbi:MAG TPA: hypothetical protein VJ488_03350, partial [Dehalococcoidia bacterium]|nr:hypothetical protein [Dehalococcoidia bacterium]
ELDAGMDAAGTRRLEEEFIRWHLGSWIGDYCLEATKYSKTPFYQGFLAVLDIFIRSEREYLHNLISNPVNTCS